MAFEKRRGSSAKYYYVTNPQRPTRKNRYVGSSRSLPASVVAMVHQHQRDRLREIRTRIREEIRAYRELEKSHRAIASRVRRHFRVELLLLGLSTHNEQMKPMAPITPRTAAPDQNETEDTWDYVERLRLRANRGDTESLAKLREVIRRRPELWNQTGDIMAASRETLLTLLSPKDAAGREAIRQYVENLGRELEAEGRGTALEKLLIEHLVLSTLQVEVTRVGMSGGLAPLARKSDVRYWAARHEIATQRFQSTCQMLYDIRKTHGTMP